MPPGPTNPYKARIFFKKMDKQLIFFLILAFLFLIGGISSLNPIMQLAGISIILILIYKKLFNTEENKKYEKNYAKGIGFVTIGISIYFIQKGLFSFFS
jgi:hypothetical protein